MSIGGRRAQRAAITSGETTPAAPPTALQEFTTATWGINANAKTSTDGAWRIAGDWVGTGGNTMRAANGTINFSNNGILSLTCSANSTNAGEIQSLTTFGHGYFECRMKVGQVAGTCQSFFLISDGYGPGEIDFEFLTGGVHGDWLNNSSTGAVMVNVHPGNNTSRVNLPFNPCADFHTYGILWRPNRIDFVVDGVIMHSRTNVPTELGSGAEKVLVMANNWTAQDSNWGGGPPAQNATAQYDFFKVWEGATAIPAGAVGDP